MSDNICRISPSTLVDEAKTLLSRAIPGTIQISRTFEPYTTTHCEIEFFYNSQAPAIPAIDTERERYTPTSILKSGNRTIVFWQDGTKTVVKRAEDERDDVHAAFAAALAIKMFGSNSALRRLIQKRLKVQKKKK